MDITRLGIDVGGTFTDFVLTDASGSDVVNFKTPSTPHDPALAIREGVRQLIDVHHLQVSNIQHFVHGTTLGVNTIVQRSGSCTGLLVTKGFRDLLEIGRLRLPDPTNYFVEKTKPLVPRHLVREIDERMSAAGKVVRPIRMDDVEAAAIELASLGVESLAICFLHSYRNPTHEKLAVDCVRAKLPGVYVCGSSDVWPQQREYERASLAVINAFIGARMDTYFSHLASNVSGLGIQATPMTTKSNGGVMTSEAARHTPVETLLSGPASGVVGALFVGRRSGYDRLIALDIGGTSAEAAVIDGDVLYSTETSIGDLPVVMPVVDVSSIGAGGGSVVWLDGMGVLKVGPRSAGADPGPACYGMGGVEATLTDAYVQLGIVDPAAFLGGRLSLDAARATEALAQIGHGIGLSATAVAAGVVEVATANMVAQLMPLMARHGIDPRDFSLVAYGGAGPTHAFFLAREIGIRRVIVPVSPGTLSALGCLVADIRQDAIKTIYCGLSDLTPDSIESEFVTLEAQCSGWLRDQHVSVTNTLLVRSADMRYKGQSFEIQVPLPEGPVEAMQSIREPFDARHLVTYGFADETAPAELINLRVTVIGMTAKPEAGYTFPSEGAPPARPSYRLVGDPNGEVNATVIHRSALRRDQTLNGPTIVEAPDTTVYIPAGYTGTVDAFGSLLIEEEAHVN
jgi:N-methylhydantoinase A